MDHKRRVRLFVWARDLADKLMKAVRPNRSKTLPGVQARALPPAATTPAAATSQPPQPPAAGAAPPAP